MDTVLRAATIYFVLLVIFRISGRKTLASMTTFDFILTLIISEAIQEALVDDDHSLTGAFLLIITLIGLDIAISLVKRTWPVIGRLTDSVPLLLVENGKLLEERCTKERVDKGDILTAARVSHGLERLEQVKHAILERNGEISIVPQAGAA